MMKRDTRSELLKAGMELIGSQGYNATGIEAVLKLAGVPKGSFYHYFSSKEDFGLAVIEEFAGRFLARLDVFLSDEAKSPSIGCGSFSKQGWSGCQRMNVLSAASSATLGWGVLFPW